MLNQPVGSSPRVRGTELGLRPVGMDTRFIPARAGNRLISGGRIFNRSVHPRACGEQTAPSAKKALTGGSSPRVRGTGSVCGRPQEVRRFIPARAGNRSTAR